MYIYAYVFIALALLAIPMIVDIQSKDNMNTLEMNGSEMNVSKTLTFCQFNIWTQNNHRIWETKIGGKRCK